jgi:hypothetical protein
LPPRGLLQVLHRALQVRRNHDSDRPGSEPLEQRRVTLEEVAEFVTQRVGVQVNEDDPAGRMEADRQAIGEVANPWLVSLSDDQVRGVVGWNSAARELVDLLG